MKNETKAGKKEKVKVEDIKKGAYFTNKNVSGMCDILIVKQAIGDSHIAINTNAFNIVETPVNFGDSKEEAIAEWLNEKDYYSLNVKIVEDK